MGRRQLLGEGVDAWVHAPAMNGRSWWWAGVRAGDVGCLDVVSAVGAAPWPWDIHCAA